MPWEQSLTIVILSQNLSLGRIATYVRVCRRAHQTDTKGCATQYAFDILPQRPWFTRVWVIQEVALAAAADVLCGSWVLSFDDLVTEVRQRAEVGTKISQDNLLSSTALSIPQKQCLLMKRLHCQLKRKEAIDMASLLSHAPGSIASDPMEYLFGVLRLASLARRLRLTSIMEKKLSLSQLALPNTFCLVRSTQRSY